MDSSVGVGGKGAPESFAAAVSAAASVSVFRAFASSSRATARATSASVSRTCRSPLAAKSSVWISWMPAASMSARFASCASGLREEVASRRTATLKPRASPS